MPGRRQVYPGDYHVERFRGAPHVDTAACRRASSSSGRGGGDYVPPPRPWAGPHTAASEAAVARPRATTVISDL
eukprot:SAG22_NODE_470_length_10142_cov_13.947227_3_plen_74_part_00